MRRFRWAAATPATAARGALTAMPVFISSPRSSKVTSAECPSADTWRVSYGPLTARTPSTPRSRDSTSATAALNAGALARRSRLWIKTVSRALWGNALSAARAAVPDSPTADWLPVNMFIGMTMLAVNARTTNASQPAIAARRCWALQRPARAAKLLAAAGCSFEVAFGDLRLERGLHLESVLDTAGGYLRRTV